MKTKMTLLVAALMFSISFGFAQQDEECMTNLSIFSDYYKSKRYDEAYEPWMKVRNKCPKFNRAIYAYGEKILQHKIDNSTGAEQVAYINDLLKLWDQAGENYPSKYELGDVLTKKGLIMYDYRKELNIGTQDLYNIFDELYNKDLKNFTHPKALYIYFSSTVDLYEGGKLELQQVFDKYDDITEKIEVEVENYTQKLNEIVEKEEAGQTSAKAKYKKSYESYLKNYEKISGSIDSKLGQLANCENLIPLYKKGFESNKNNAVWLKRAVSRMYNKECTDDPLYVDLVKAYDATEPSADTKYFVATILFKQNKNTEAMKYLKQAYDLQTDSYKKGRLAKRIGNILKSKGRYSEARDYYTKALKLNPSDGSPHLSIANMYANSANNCGSTTFEKQAMFWYAAQEARKAGRVDANIKSMADKTAANYEAKAPTRSQIFTEGNSGQVIRFKCWVGGSVTVPSL